MGRTRLELHQLLCDILGTPYCYFQPDTNIKLRYPCIVYERSTGDTRFAGNAAYTFTKRYTVTVIDPDPDSLIPDKIAALPMCKFDRSYTADNLCHDVFNIYF